MKRVELLVQDKLYNQYIQKNIDLVKDQLIFQHDFQHHLDVARIAYILILEDAALNIFIKECNLSGKLAAKEVIYASGLLHDIGKWKEYSENIDHAIFGADFAREILARVFFTANEIDIISHAVFEHNNINIDMSFLGERIYRADNFARVHIHHRMHRTGPKIIPNELSVSSFEY